MQRCRTPVEKVELAKRMDGLESVEVANAQAQGDLLYLRRLVEDLNLRLNEAIDASKKDRLRANRMEIACFTAADDWRVELEAMQKQHQVEISRLQREEEDLKHEVVLANKAKVGALMMAREAMLAGEEASKQVASLSTELEKAMVAIGVSRQETLECRRALDELAKQKTDASEAYAASATLVAEKEAELKKQMAALFQVKQQAEQLRWELFDSRKNETRLCEMSNELDILKKQAANAKQIEAQQAKVVMDVDARLREAGFEVQQARAAKNEVENLLSLTQGELEEMRQKWMMTNAEVSANAESMKDELERLQMQIRLLQGKNAELETELLKASEKLAKSLSGEQKKDEALDFLGCSLEAARLEFHLLRQQIYEAVFEAQFGEVEITEELMSIHKVLKVAECMASKARADLQDMLNELCSERELTVLGSSLKERSFERLLEGLSTNKESLATMEVDVLPHDQLSFVAACKPAAVRIAFDLKVIREQLDRIREEAEILVAVMSESISYHQEKEQVSDETLSEPDQGRVEVSTKTAKINYLQENSSGVNALDVHVEVQGKFRELSEPWEMVDSGSEAIVTIKKEEYDALKHRVHEAMEVKSSVEAQLLSLKSSNQRLLTQLDATNTEIKALRLSEQSMFQQYDKLQQRNMLLEAEVQSIKGKGEQFLNPWELGNASYGLDVNVLNGSQPMKLDKKLHQTSLPLSISRDFSSSEKEEEESTEFLSLSSKKKKKALYLRIGTFLTKKIN